MDGRDIVAVGGSLGAPTALIVLCQDIPADFPASLFITVHVGALGKDLLAGILNERSALTVTTAVDGDVPRWGYAYVAPADRHLLLVDGMVRLGRGPRENLARPAIDPLFRSVGVCYGARAIGLVLTGMLNDGAAGLADLKRCGGTTVVQNPADAEAADMPLGALRASDIDYRADLDDLPGLLKKLVVEPAGPQQPIPDDIKLEVDIALGRPVSEADIACIADPVPLSCPSCGGVLSQLRKGSQLRFRCQVGHGYSAESLAVEQEPSVDEALRISLRILGERALLADKMATEARSTGRHAAAALSQKRARESRNYARVLEEAIRRKRDRETG